MKVALLFFGLTRSLTYTIDSIKQNVLSPLVSAGIKYDTFLHTYDLAVTTNARSGETNVLLNTTEWQLLAPNFKSITSQEDFVREYEASMLACRATGDFYGNEFATITNLFYQLNSIRLVTALWRDSRRVYDAVVYLRPDLLYNCRFPVAQLQDLAPNTWYVADNHHFEGLNDRFVMARPSEAALWGDRLYFTFATCSRMQIHSESQVLRLALHHRLRVERLPFSFYRLRATGVLESHDFAGPDCIAQCDAAMFEPFLRREEDLVARGALGGSANQADPCKKAPLCMSNELEAASPPPPLPLVTRMWNSISGDGMVPLVPWARKDCFAMPESNCPNCNLLAYSQPS